MKGLAPNCSALDDVTFHGVAGAAKAFEVRNSGIDRGGFSAKLQNHPSRMRFDIGPPKVGNDIELLHDLVQHRAFDEFFWK